MSPTLKINHILILSTPYLRVVASANANVISNLTIRIAFNTYQAEYLNMLDKLNMYSFNT